MSNNVTPMRGKTVLELDGFNDFTDEVEGDDGINTGGSIIQGPKLKFLDPDWWIEKQNVTGKRLTAINVVNVSTKWGQNGNPLVTNILAPGEKFPDFDKLNAEMPQKRMADVFRQRGRALERATLSLPDRRTLQSIYLGIADNDDRLSYRSARTRRSD